jgi:ribulose-phosphate 3-epimerase
MGDEAVLDGDEVVAVPGPEAGATGVVDAEPHGRAIGEGLERRAGEDLRVDQAAHALQGFPDHPQLQLDLGVVGDVLPAAPSAPGGDVWAWWRPAVVDRRHDLDHTSAGEVALLLGELGADPLTRQGATEEHDPAGRLPGDGVAASRHPLGVDLDHGHGRTTVAGGPSDTVPRVGRPILIAPSVLPADFARLGEEVAALEEAGVDRIQWDVMDGQFVPNITFGPDVIAAARRACSVPFEAHLMVRTPELLFREFVDAGVERLIVHAESTLHLHRTLDQVRQVGAAAAVAIVPSTPAVDVRYVLDLVDMVLVMTVNPGFGGQDYIATMEPKIAEIRQLVDDGGYDVDVEVDGGISEDTVAGAVAAGANVLVSGSALYRDPLGLPHAVATLRKLAEEAQARS